MCAFQTCVLTHCVASVAVIAIQPTGLGENASLAAGYVALALVTFINAVSVRWADRVNRYFTVFKSIALAMIGILGVVALIHGGSGTPASENLRDSFRGSTASVGSFGVATLAGLVRL